jgi:hypothetical protein
MSMNRLWTARSAGVYGKLVMSCACARSAVYSRFALSLMIVCLKLGQNFLELNSYRARSLRDMLIKL